MPVASIRSVLWSTIALAVVGAGLASQPSGADPGRSGGAPTVPSDFDGDGFGDLAIGVSGETVEGVDDAGAVLVLNGSAGGLSAVGTQRFTQETGGIRGIPEEEDHFGNTLATGDFNGDGLADLAVGFGNERVDGVFDVGAVVVLYGSANGLQGEGSDYWTQSATGILENEDHAGFGRALTVGDFGKGVQDDLAIGAPGATVEGRDGAGYVTVLFGSGRGLRTAGAQGIQQTTGAIEVSDGFGAALAAGDLGRSSHDDLAVGVPNEDVESTLDAGAVSVFHGSRMGLQIVGAQGWVRSSANTGDVVESDHFGFSLAIADFGRSRHADLAVGVPDDDLGEVGEAGSVDILYGGPDGIQATGNESWNQGVAGPDPPEDFDRFGFHVAAGDFGRGGRADLAVGVFTENGGEGAVNVIYGGADGLTQVGAQVWRQDAFGDPAQPGDVMGATLAAASIGKGRFGDLVVGIPGDVVGSVEGGAVGVLYGTRSGLSAAGAQLWSEASPGVPGQPADNDRFGDALA